jgi:RND family efflux transporter MFP subunit
MAEADLNRLKIDKSHPRGRRRRHRPLFWGLALSVVAIAILALTGVFTPAAQVKVATASLVYPAENLTLLNASGYVVAQRQAALAAKATGRLVWLGVEEGSRVKAGEIVARLESDDVAAARDQAAATLRQTRTAVASALAEQRDARLALRRDQQLLAAGALSQADFEAATSRDHQAVAALAGARAAVGAARAALKVAEVNLENTTIRAPFDAVVLTKDADVGDIVTPLAAAADAKAAVVTIADLSSLQVEADVSESNLEQVRVGQPCEIQLDAFPDQRFAGTVHMIVPTADRTKATVMVKVRFDRLDSRILPEMSARVAFLKRPLKVKERAPRLAVDKSAVTTRGGRPTVFRVVDGRAAATPVVLGGPIGDWVAVSSGLKAGDKVVLAPPSRLKDGARVKTVIP